MPFPSIVTGDIVKKGIVKKMGRAPCYSKSLSLHHFAQLLQTI